MKALLFSKRYATSLKSPLFALIVMFCMPIAFTASVYDTTSKIDKLSSLPAEVVFNNELYDTDLLATTSDNSTSSDILHRVKSKKRIF